MHKLDVNDPNVWDQWRSEYDQLNIEAQQEFHNDIEDKYPDQKHFDLRIAKEVFEISKSLNIMEVGGWKGDLADIILYNNPQIQSWLNIELCPAAIEKSVCLDERYCAIEPPKFDWFDTEDRSYFPDILIATHVIEHLSNEHFEKLINYSKGIPYLYFEAPLSQEGNQWNNYIGTHKLNYGWSDVEDIVRKAGYELVINKNGQHGGCRLFKLRT